MNKSKFFVLMETFSFNLYQIAFFEYKILHNISYVIICIVSVTKMYCTDHIRLR